MSSIADGFAGDARHGVGRPERATWNLVLCVSLFTAGQAQTCSNHDQCANETGSTRASYCDTSDDCHYCAWLTTAAEGTDYWSSCQAVNNAIVRN